MNPNRGEGLPNSEMQPMVTPEVTDANAEASVEATPAHQESAPSKQRPAPIAKAADDVQAVADDQAQALVQISDTTQPAVSATAHADSDRIEKQWVDSAKQIVAQTKDDPYKQKNEMSKVKAEYIKHRFNKVIKADTEAV